MGFAVQRGQIYAETRALAQLEKLLSENNFSRVFFLTDENTHEHCLLPLLQHIKVLPDFEILEIEPGEGSKDPEILFHLWEALAAQQADRQSLIINVGGGVVTDLGGFLAATYLRGIACINFPTSLLAMVDAASGGKTGINLGGLKNLVGSFSAPLMVGLWPDFLHTLPFAERRAGYAEMLKHGLIASAKHLESIADVKDYLPSMEQIEASVALKEKIVAQDPQEQGLRKVLNFGHTIGHALETQSHREKQPLLHGEAVGLGMLAETRLSQKMQLLSPDEATTILHLLEKHFGAFKPQWNPLNALPHLKADKKNENGEPRYSLLTQIGAARYNVAVPHHYTVQCLESLSL